MGLTSKKPVVPLTRFQRDWVRDDSRFKLAVKSRRIGFTFGTTLEIALDAASRRTRWLIISRTQDTAKEAIGETRNHLLVMKKVEATQAPVRDVETDLFFEGVRLHKFVIELPNGSEITAMTAHPDAARGFGGNVFLDEHGFHRDSKELWKGAAASTMRGHRLIVVSTPHYQLGNYYEIARKANAVSGRAPAERQQGIWSTHWVDIHTAAPQLREIGVKVDLDELRELAGDEETWAQEFCCQFLTAAEMWIGLELIAAARSPEASAEWDPQREVQGWLYAGYDIARKRDLAVVYIKEQIANVGICRGIVTMRRATFEQQFEILCGIVSHPRMRRLCVDATGMGMPVAERLQEKFGSKVEPVTFTQETKENMAVLARRRYEEKLEKIPENAPALEASLGAIKRQVTASGALRFDAARTDAGHADEAWANFLAIAAADSGVAAACAGIDPEEQRGTRSAERGADPDLRSFWGNESESWDGLRRKLA